MVQWQLAMATKCPNETLIIVDAYDTLFVGDADQLESMLEGEQLVYCASKVCWPDRDKESCYSGDHSLWRYLNGSVMAGKGFTIRKAIEWGLEHAPIKPPVNDGRLIYHEDNDQRFWTDVYLHGYGSLDTNCEIFQNLACIKDEEFALVDGKFLNTVTATNPQFIHAAAHTWNLIPKELYA